MNFLINSKETGQIYIVFSKSDLNILHCTFYFDSAFGLIELGLALPISAWLRFAPVPIYTLYFPLKLLS